MIPLRPADRLRAPGRTAPFLRKDMNYATFFGLPDWSKGPREDLDQVATALREVGVQAVQARDPEPFLAAGFAATGMGRVLTAAEADPIARAHRALGLDATTLHVGNGLETDAEANTLVAAVLEASARHGHPMYLETHRATITQDMRRTLDLVARFPELRFNADLSHWYAGQELTYGDFDAKLARLGPVFARVRFVHGRVCDSGCLQRAPKRLEDGPALEHFRRMWALCFRGFLAEAEAGHYLPFATELLPARARIGGETLHLNYAQLAPGADGVLREESDRWEDAEQLWALASEVFDAEVAALDFER